MKKLMISLLMMFIHYAAVADCQSDLNNINQALEINGQLTTQTNIIIVSPLNTIDMTTSLSCVADCQIKVNTSTIKARCSWNQGNWNDTLLAY
ncbi:MAG: hypothetical protein ORN24_04350 [Burkholderiales bacterium]|jgi:hypothetical protein|nr:hypothetical protein [Burkholderiales bacterium]